MSVFLNPSNSLGFNRPLTTLVKRALTITNPHAQPVAFKVKTTAPKLYCVRPNSGRIEPGSSVEVSVMLQPLKEEPPMNAKCKDKFLIQSTLMTPEKEQKSLQDIWSTAEGDTDEANKIHQVKLKVVYLPPEGQVLEEEDENMVNQSSLMNEPPQFDTVRQHPIPNGHDIPEFTQEGEPSTSLPQDDEVHHDAHEEVPAPPVSVFIQPPETFQPPPEFPVPESVPAPPAPVTAPAATAPPPPPAAPAPPDLTEDLMIARAEIDRLRSLLAAAAPPPELRKRTRRLSDDITIAPSDVGTMIDEPMPQEGVPLQVVVIISLGVFIMTYLFF
ncbi:PapD-like protein [Lentinula raphanica]|uniref:PapD-like protein n=1 Tax=Lentinula raphanica TaxID=153919 RepID=A0AA38P6B8_9AGAR|nr:PapD-like protein [Lentinula raphanica]KAJ3837142.1 PapD-like protein [Lentinula raphanica]KAJ3973248.1 PapD-like protein [Lentinula raphanica]